MKSKNVILISLFISLSLNSTAQTSSETVEWHAKKIYQLALDSIPNIFELELFNWPYKPSTYADSVLNLIQKDSLYFLSEYSRNMISTERNNQKPVNYKNCDSCQSVIYIYQSALPINIDKLNLDTGIAFFNNIKWTIQSDTSVKLTDFTSKNFTFLYIDEDRKVLLHYKNKMLYEAYGDFFLGWISLLNIVFSADLQYAYLIIDYNDYYIGEIFFEFHNNNWIISNKNIKSFCCF